MSAATPTSPAMAATFPFAPAPMVLTASSRAPRPRAMTATSAPEAANRVAIARPIPLLPPVITAVRPARRTFIFDPPDGAGLRTRVTSYRSGGHAHNRRRQDLLFKPEVDTQRNAGDRSAFAAISDLAAVISPVQERLPLPRAAGQVTRLAVPLDLPDMPAYGFPSLDLPPVFGRHAAAHIVAAIPMEPAARIIGVKPSLATPDR